MNKLIFAAVIAAIAALGIPSAVNTYAQTTTTTTTTVHHHFFWRHNLANPFGFGRGNNIVVIPSNVLGNSVAANQCPAVAPILLSTGQCITVQQALYEEQTGQLSLAGNVQAFGSQVVGTPIVIQGGNLFHHFHHFHQ